MNLKKIKDNFEDEHLAVPEFDLEHELNSLLAEEFQAAYDYFKVYPFITGAEGKSVRDEFYKHYEEEMVHATKLIERINNLGYTNRVVSLSSIPEFTSLTPTVWDISLVNQCTFNRDAEGAAINHYSWVIQQLGDTDPVTTDLLKEILADEQEHYNDLQDFINDAAANIL